MPTDHATERRAALSPARRALLAKLMRGGAPHEPGTIRPRADDGPAPLSGAQRRLWFLHQLDPASAAFNISPALRMRGALDVAALDRALVEVVRRHHALRTVFRVVDGAPAQEVVAAPESLLAVEDVGGYDAGAREAEARRIAAREAARPFDLASEPGIRALLLRLAADDHVLVLTLHHIVSDGWSTGIVYRELGELYAAFTRGEPSPLPPLAIQYADFAAWQRDRLEGSALEPRLAFWRAALAGAPPLLDLPTDRPRPAVRGSRGAAHRFRIPGELAARLATLGRGESATPFMVLLAGYAALLARWSGHDDVVVGTPLAGRARAETEGLVGFFVQTLPLRVDLAADPTFRELLRRVRRATTEAYANADVPFDRLVDELGGPRSLGHAPVFQAMLTLQNAAGSAAPALRGIHAEPLRQEIRAAENDLLLYMEEDHDGLDAILQYATDLFDAPTVARMADHFLALLAAATADPDLRVSALPLMSPDERAMVIGRWNLTGAPYPALPAHALISARAALAPEAAAVACAGESLSYAEVESRANRLARRLIGAGAGPETRVAISMARSPALVVALLATWKAGAAYVPVDPAYPRERRAYMLRDCGATLVLTDAASRGGLPPTDAPVMVVDALELAGEDDTPPAPGVDLDALAYVIYTSGSTGRPKGVMVPHRGVASFLASMRREPGISRGDVLVAVTSLSFDIAVLELILPLVAGARLVLATRDEATDAGRLAALLRREGATVMQATPATWRLLLQHGWIPDAGLALLCGGEALPPELARRLLAPARALWNLYGPTETTIWSTAHRVRDAESIPLGLPIANTRLYVVDAAMNPAPVGVPGELWIGGDGVARGYLGRPALTAERFVPDPFSGLPGARLYRTGDRARRRADGTLDFMGRIDFQVKVRGFRIELGEIEAALASIPGIRQALAIVREDTPGDARIVAYVVPDGGAPAHDALRRELARHLPDYMVPSALVTLAALPLTPNGKTDRAALPAPDGASLARDTIPPRTPAEATIAGFWREALGVERVGVEDNFFELGGHSLLVARVHARLTAAFPRQVTMLDMFRHTTVAALAAFVADDGEAPPATPAPGLARAGARRAAAANGARRRGR
ncbi:MAG TPA: amino acid adenylation domain-containing protein [Longimicrobium sp.]|nr:amino acid adenylation domain-containing protein [Longimicrobium sp.]